MAHAALRLQGFDQLLEGQVLMRLRAERRLAGLREQPRQPHAAVHGAAQHLRIDEEADDASVSVRLRLATGTPTRMSSCPV